MSDPELTPAEEQVRRLLADARHDEPLPTDVADRLDRVLGELQDEDRRTPPAVDLAARRRRRVARNLLVAAAAVVVVGVGIRAVDLGVQGDADSGGAGSSAMESEPQASDDGGDAVTGRELATITGPPVVLSSDDLEGQVRRLSRGDGIEVQAQGAADPSAPNSWFAGESAPPDQDDLSARAKSWCDDPAWGAGQRVAVRYDGERGVLVLREPAGDARDVDLYLCGETVPTRSVTIPAG